ncbi:MATE family efflux transporter [Dyella sp.]|jgi:MATE family multidrug resistance protein|uniref:MATE family efflux transporter n=1 Tax=Dyella sp. TaxID=1869338 RepID=UPI002D78802B|nr:MATE family efflux transporter [Dyella sp.]HET6431135.1 MATE family efflux transporter [Dyella sp.]
MPSLRQGWAHRATHVRVWRLAAPMIASNLTVPLVTLVDSVMAGHLAHAGQLGAVAVGSAIYSLPIWIFGFLRMGTIGFAAQASGRADGDALRRLLVQALLLAVGLAGATVLLAWPLLGPLLHLMKPSTTLDGLTRTYLHVRLVGLPAALANAALIGWFLGMHNAGMALRVTVVTNVVNIALNGVFVLGLHAGVLGIAASSVCGEWIGTLVGLTGIAAQLRRYPGRLPSHALRRWASWRPLMAVNRDILIRSLALQGVFFAVTVLGTRLGDSVVAANALLLNGLLLAAFALDGLANAVEALAGHAVGARDRVALRRALVVAGGWSLIGSALFALCFGMAGRLFVDLQTDITPVREIAYGYLAYLTALPLVGVWSYLYDGLFVGATRAREMRDAMLVAGVAFVVLAFALRGWGNHGLWLAFLGFMLVRAGTMAWMARRISRRDGWMGARAGG